MKTSSETLQKSRFCDKVGVDVVQQKITSSCRKCLEIQIPETEFMCESQASVVLKVNLVWANVFRFFDVVNCVKEFVVLSGIHDT